MLIPMANAVIISLKNASGIKITKPCRNDAAYLIALVGLVRIKKQSNVPDNIKPKTNHTNGLCSFFARKL